MSRAEVICSSAGRPFGLTQLDCVMPSRREAAFISSANPSIEPDDALGEHDRDVVRRLHHHHLEGVVDRDLVPGVKPIFDGACAAAFGDTVSSVSSASARPSRP